MLQSDIQRRQRCVYGKDAIDALTGTQPVVSRAVQRGQATGLVAAAKIGDQRQG
jgi:hypothetical protein